MKLGLLCSLLLGVSRAHLFESCLPSESDSPVTVPKLFTVRSDLATLDQEEMLAISTLSGFLARSAPLLGLVSKVEDLVWLSEVAHETVDLSSLEEVLGQDSIPTSDCSYVLCKVGDNSTNAALSYAAASDECTIVATTSTAPLLESYGINMAKNVTGVTDPLWALDHLSDKFNKHVSILQNAGNPVPLSDLTVKCRALNWWGWGECGKELDDPEGLTERALGLLTPGDAVVAGWGGGDDPEWNCVHASTSYGSFGMIAADQALNLAVLNASPETIKQRPAAVRSKEDARDGAEPKHTVCFVMSDGDNVQWIINDWSAEKGANGWWASTERGDVKLGWTLSPSLAALAPAALSWIMAGGENARVAKQLRCCLQPRSYFSRRQNNLPCDSLRSLKPPRMTSSSLAPAAPPTRLSTISPTRTLSRPLPRSRATS